MDKFKITTIIILVILLISCCKKQIRYKTVEVIKIIPIEYIEPPNINKPILPLVTTISPYNDNAIACFDEINSKNLLESILIFKNYIDSIDEVLKTYKKSEEEK